MAVRFVAFAALLACLHTITVAAPLTLVDETLSNFNPQKSYSYEVQEPQTEDSHGHVQTRSGNIVQDFYTLLDSDGTKRVVHYSADGIGSFNTVVSKQPLVITAPALITSSYIGRVATPAVVPTAHIVKSTPVIAPPPPRVAPAIYNGPNEARVPNPGSLFRSGPYAKAPLIADPVTFPPLTAAPWKVASNAKVW